MFFRHAKRTTVNADDVKMLIRKSPKLVKYFEKRKKIDVIEVLLFKKCQICL